MAPREKKREGEEGERERERKESVGGGEGARGRGEERRKMNLCICIWRLKINFGYLPLRLSLFLRKGLCFRPCHFNYTSWLVAPGVCFSLSPALFWNCMCAHRLGFDVNAEDVSI